MYGKRRWLIFIPAMGKKCSNIMIPTGNAPISNASASQNSDVEIINPNFNLPYKGKMGENCLRTFKNQLKNFLPAHVHPRITFKGKKLGSCFRVKDLIKKEHQTDLVYGFIPNLEGNNKIKYIGETNVRLGTRTDEHANSGSSAINRDSTILNYEVSLDDFIVLDKGYNKVTDRKIAEALYIKDIKPTLNEQIRSHKLQLFN